MASPCTPPRARRASSPSTMKCPWSCWIEKWITRKRSTDARAMARRSAPNTRGDRSDGSPGAARIVTCTGQRGSILGLVVWGIEGRPRGFRPAPLRAPPQVLAAASGRRICRVLPRLIPRMFRCRRRRRRGAWPRPLGSEGPVECAGPFDSANVRQEVTSIRARACATGCGRRLGGGDLAAGARRAGVVGLQELLCLELHGVARRGVVERAPGEHDGAIGLAAAARDARLAKERRR